MLLVFQVITLLIVTISFFGVIGERKDIELRNNLTVLCIGNVFAFVLGTWLL